MAKEKKEEKSPNLVTKAKYASLVGASRQAIANRLRAGTLTDVEVHGVKFINLDQYPVENFGAVRPGRPWPKKEKKVPKTAK